MWKSLQTFHSAHFCFRNFDPKMCGKEEENHSIYFSRSSIFSLIFCIFEKYVTLCTTTTSASVSIASFLWRRRRRNHRPPPPPPLQGRRTSLRPSALYPERRRAC